MLLTLFAIFGMLVRACIPPFNGVRYLDNATLLDEAVAQMGLYLQTGGATIVGGMGPARNLPAGDPGQTFIIPYCMADQYSESHLAGIMEKAWNLWFKKLGTPAASTGHRLGGFWHVINNGKLQRCFTDYKNKIWNPLGPAETLVVDASVTHSLRGMSTATLDYIPDSCPAVHRHRMDTGYYYGIPEDYTAWLTAHEKGHVFGLIYELSREDRDHHDHFECKNLEDCDQVVARLKANSIPNVDIDTICGSQIWGHVSQFDEIGFAAPAFSTLPFMDPYHKDKGGNPNGDKHPYTVPHSNDYDMMSIMQYASVDFIKQGNRFDVYSVPLVQWNHSGPNVTPPKEVTEDNALIIIAWDKLSTDDVDMIKSIYPYVG
ncbi:hypothetical protein EJ02DRAFT_345787 [Clathrospora elynae]|uniref:Peptidase M12A domain-containing protein n=1 Tax=Clathrospora elynae TaxID=706981 RepID=A0A6A5SS27_9PLEO|nr:hypothetical protein EJ02DRAFT_345787 [Clathrospora elynae]